METPPFAALLAQHRNDIYRLALRLVGNRADAEDIVQESLLHAWRSISSFNGKARIRTWLHRIATNAARMHRRAARRRPTDSLQEVLPDFDQTVIRLRTRCRRIAHSGEGKTGTASLRREAGHIGTVGMAIAFHFRGR